MPADVRHKSVRAEYKADGSSGEFTALFSVFDNLDRDGDVIRKGAFAPAFDENPNPPVVWTHRWDIPPIGETLDAEETENGAKGHGKLYVDDHPVAKQVWLSLKSGALRQYSFAYEIADGGSALRDPEDDEKTARLDGQVRELTEFSTVYEWGPTLAGANPETYTIDSPKTLETLLGVKAEDLRAALGIDVVDVFAEIHDLAKPKSGRRNSTKDAERLQTIHDLAVENGAKCAEPDHDPDADDEPETDEEKDRAERASELLAATSDYVS